jgi:hypothetical protein
MSDIYEQHKAAFANVAAYVILDSDHELVATVAFKYPRDGAGRLYAYVHWIGVEMVRGFAAGGGYDKHSAACSSAVHRMWDGKQYLKMTTDAALKRYDAFRVALAKDDGAYWHNHLRDAGFTVMQAV